MTVASFELGASDILARRARRAYERGRLRWALARGVPAAGLTVVALAGCAAPAGPAACIVVLGLALAALLWRGGSWSRGAHLGFAAGLVPCWLPGLVHLAHGRCDGFCLTLPSVCLVAGLAAGLLVGWRGLKRHGDSRFWIGAASVAVLAGMIGCLPAGLAGLGGMALGMLAGVAAPVCAARLA